MSEEISQFWLWRGTQPWTRGPRAQRLYPPQVASGGGTRQSALPRLSPGRRAAREGGGGARRELSWAPQAGRQAGGLRAEHCSGWQPERPSPRRAIRPALVHCLTSPSGLSGGCPASRRSREAAAAQETQGAWGEPRWRRRRGHTLFWWQRHCPGTSTRSVLLGARHLPDGERLWGRWVGPRLGQRGVNQTRLPPRRAPF